MVNIFNYLNYRKFLQDFYDEQKRTAPAFSFQYFAKRTGFKSRSFLKLVMDGKKNLSEESARKFNAALKLDAKEFSYFQDLITFNQTDSPELRNVYFTRLMQYNKRNKARVVIANQYEFYAKWYHNTIRELVGIVDFKENYGSLAKMVTPAISPREARQSIKLLLELGLIQKKNGKYHQVDRVITTGDEVRSLAVGNFHKENLDLAKGAMSTCPPDKRDLSCLVLSLSPEAMGAVKSEIKAFRKKLLAIANDGMARKHIYHVSFQMFPTGSAIAKENTRTK